MTTQKKKLLIGFTAAALVLCVVIVVLRIAGSPAGAALLDLKAQSELAEARAGAVALRAQGCRSAIVFATRALEASLGKLRDGGVSLTSQDDPALYEVECHGAPANKRCDELARAFVAAEATLEGPFHLVAYDDDDKPQCTGYFDAKGASMGPSVVR